MRFHLVIIGALLCFAPLLEAVESAPDKPNPELEAASSAESGQDVPAQPKDSVTSTPQVSASDSGVAKSTDSPNLERIPAGSGTAKIKQPGKQVTSAGNGAADAPPNLPAPAAQEADAPPNLPATAAQGADAAETEHRVVISEGEVPTAGDFQSEIIHSDPDIHENEPAAAAAGELTEPKGEGAEPGSLSVTPDGNSMGAESAPGAPMPQSAREKSAAIGPAQESAIPAPALPADGPVFPTSPLIERQIGFWIKIFSEFHSQQGLIHDKNLTLPIYAEVNLEGLTRRQQRRYLKRFKRKLERELKQLAKTLKAGEEPDQDGQALLKRLPKGVTSEEIRELANGVRFQRGLADRFREGLVRSGAVLEEIKRILALQGVPTDLAYLPHVESSYNLRGYSKFGAAGIWQFTRGTGRKFLSIKYEVDERLDPFRSTHAAALFLRQNFDRLGSWPLAITAYNHGPQGIERIVKLQETNDLTTLIRVCGCRLFKFASKNFYSEFLAARKVATNYQAYFGTLQLEPELQFNEVPMPFYMEFSTALEIMGIEESSLRVLNPALRSPVIIGSKYIPKGYQLRVPPRVDPAQFVKSVPKSDRMNRQKLTEVALVRRGDTLYGLGLRHGISWRVIARANNITAYHRIRPGQRLVIPRRGKSDRLKVGDAVAKVDARNRRQEAAGSAASTGNGRLVAARVAGNASNGNSSSIAFQRAEGAYLFQNFDIRRYNPESGAGVIESAYGETLGHYAEWAGVSTLAIRRHNRRYNGVLRPGDRVVIPLSKIGLEAFSQQRFEYHQSREEDFFSTYGVAEVIKVKVRRGDTVWNIAQSNNVPMWLFYQQNPRLLKRAVRAGKQIDLPIIEALSELQKTPGENTKQAAN